MAEEATVKVRLDTRQAKGDLRQLNKEAAKSGGRLSGGIRKAVGRGMGAVGIGGGVGLGLAAVRGSTSSGLGDVIGEGFSVFAAQLNERFLGKADDEARAIRKAREETIQAFGYQAGVKNGIPDGARNFFNQRVADFREEEEGRALFEQNKDFAGPQFDDILKKIMSEMGKLISEAVDNLAAHLVFWK